MNKNQMKRRRRLEDPVSRQQQQQQQQSHPNSFRAETVRGTEAQPKQQRQEEEPTTTSSSSSSRMASSKPVMTTTTETTTDDGGDTNNSVDHTVFLKPFGREDVYGENGEGSSPHKVSGRNVFSYYFARGSFGELSIGIRRVYDVSTSQQPNDHLQQHASSSAPPTTTTINRSTTNDSVVDDDKSNNNNNNNITKNARYAFVAIKTIDRAIEPKNGRRGGLGGGQSFGFGSSNINNNGNNVGGSSSLQYQLNKDVFNEIMALQLLQGHPNIVNLRAMYPTPSNQNDTTTTTGSIGSSSSSSKIETSTSLSLVFDYCPTDLHESLQCIRTNLLTRHNHQLEECTWQDLPSSLLSLPTIYSLIDDTIRAVEHCHDCGIIHGDIKPGNLLITSRGRIQLCDFGIAKPFHIEDDNNDDTDRALCTLYYRPPEILLGGRSRKPSVDMWSVGCVLSELLLVSAGITSPALFPGRNVLDQLSLIYHTVGTPTPETWPTVEIDGPDYGKLSFQPRSPRMWGRILPYASERSPILLELASSLVCLDPSKRLTATDALSTISSVWVTNGNKNKEVASTKDDARKQVQAEILNAAKLWIPPMLDSTNPVLASKVAAKIAETRRTISVR